MKKKNEGKTRQEVLRDYDAKRKAQPKLNAIRDVPTDIIRKLERLTDKLGSKKAATIKAIELLYEKEFEKNE